MLAAGTRIGAYEILSPLGQGGMGEVYRARDATLGRDVAIKILRDPFARDADRLKRFEREAQILAALSHPHIAQVYGLERTPGTTALVMELVDGPTLAERIAEGPLPVGEALAIARQIAGALEAAHERGIVHRDLKPANIKVRTDGIVKVLDFGLARARVPEDEAPDVSRSPTIMTPAVTQAGLILGTPAYMSPEQARGQAVDQRTDVWAFGAVLFEMLSGTRVFGPSRAQSRDEGDGLSDTLAAVLRAEPDWTMLPADVPPDVRRVIGRCLEKDRTARIPGMAVVRFLLDDANRGPAATVDVAPARGKTLSGRERAAWAAALLGLVIVGATVALRPGGLDAPREVIRFAIAPPAGGAFPGANATPRMALSPDGRSLAFTLSTEDGLPDQLWIRRLDALDAVQVGVNTETAGETLQSPFWSPDGRFIGFFVNGRLKKIDVSSGVVQTLSDVPGNNMGGTWNRDGTIVFGSSLTNGLQRVSANGGVPVPVTTLDASAGETAHLWPRFLPGGRHVLFQVWTEASAPAIAVGALESPDVVRVLESPYAAFAPPGHLLFIRNGALLAQPFDTGRMVLHGDPVPLAESVQVNVSNGRAAFTVSENGVLVYRPGGTLAGDSQLAWMDRSGGVLETVGPPAAYRGIALSPDGRRAAVHRDEGDDRGDIWVVDLARGAHARLTFDASQHNAAPIWSGDGQRVLFSRASPSPSILERHASGVGDERVVHEGGTGLLVSWSSVPGRRGLLFGHRAADAGFDLWRLDPEDGAPDAVEVGARGVQAFTQVSPDGRWIAYAASGSVGRRAEVWVESFPRAGTRYQVSSAGGTQPRWRGDGRELFFLPPADSAVREMRVVAVEPEGDGLRIGPPMRLFDARAVAFFPHTPPAYSYDVTADGQRFLVARLPGDATRSPFEAPLIVVVNWDVAVRPSDGR